MDKITKPIETIFFGTNEFAAVILKALRDSGLFNIKLVITQPDKPVGRHQEIQKSPIRILAEQYGIKFEQPESLKNYKLSIVNYIPYNLRALGKENRGFLSSHLLDYELAIVVEYGLMIPDTIIMAPRFGTINIHPSLLPKYRGASPIQSALINSETETGISIMLIDDKMDHGPILAQEKTTIGPDENFLELRERLAPMAAALLLNTIPLYLNGQIKPISQDDGGATFCKIFTRDDGKIDFNKTADEIYNQYRGLTPWPGIFAAWNGKRLKFIKISRAEMDVKPGQVKIEQGRMFVGCNKNAIEILDIQPEGKKVMAIKNFINGNIDINNSNLN